MKIRPVFDAFAKINNHPSLNDCLETGNNLIESVPAILARFRLKPIGVISDIRRAFPKYLYMKKIETSVQNNAELRIFVESATNVMKEGMIDLRGWESSAIPSESMTSLVLGLIWDKNSDILESNTLEGRFFKIPP
ncbi:pro-Pol polyprotein [Trichonephila clavipes]|nr:pro-Pol polyprotein [Trichonephila clavipes]